MKKFESYKNWINEKFTDESDPIVDMSIGAVNQFEKLMDLFAKEDDKKYIYTIAPYDGKHIDFWFSYPTIQKLTQKEIDGLFHYIKNILYDKLGFAQILTSPKLILGYEDKQKKTGYLPMVVRFNMHDKIKNVFKRGEYRRVEPKKDKIEFYIKIENINAYENEVRTRTYKGEEEKTINEKFTQDSDPVRDLGIGSRKIIEQWIENINNNHTGGNYIPFEKYIIDEQLRINVHQHSYLPDNCGDLPEYINFGKIKGLFSVINCDLTTLRGMPEYVQQSFYCSKNNLTSLKFAPKYVGGDFKCENNIVKFTKQDVRAVCEVKGNIIV